MSEGTRSSSSRDQSDSCDDQCCSQHPRRRRFWRNVFKQFNFPVDLERQLLLPLADGIDWTHMNILPRSFMERHREVFYLIADHQYAWSDDIERDVTRTFSIFNESDDILSRHQSLFRVLNALAEAEGGYCQGMNFIAALFLVEGVEEADAYALFLYLLRKRHLGRIFQRKSTYLDDYLHHFSRMLQTELPDLHSHLLAQGFSIPMYGVEWITTLFTLSCKTELACAILDMFFVGIRDIFLRLGLAIFKLLEPKLLCMTLEDFLLEFKPLVRQIDPYQAVFQALTFHPNPLVGSEDTTLYLSRVHTQLQLSLNTISDCPLPPRSFRRHHTFPPYLVQAIEDNDFPVVYHAWQALVHRRPFAYHCTVLSNEILHFSVWFGRTSLAVFAIERCGADVNNMDDWNLTPLHFAAIRNQPDAIRLLLCYGADDLVSGGTWDRSLEGLTPLETCENWRFNDTTAAKFVLEQKICLYCNTRIEWLDFGAASCSRCRFQYCDRPYAACIAKHHCPSDYHPRQQSPASLQGDPERSLSSIEWSRRSGNNSASDSSFIYIPSPVHAFSCNEDEESDIFSDYVPERQSVLEFPDHPTWYCNASTCHFVFVFYSHRGHCHTCQGYFCSSHFTTSTKVCTSCQEHKYKYER